MKVEKNDNRSLKKSVSICTSMTEKFNVAAHQTKFESDSKSGVLTAQQCIYSSWLQALHELLNKT